MPDDDELRPTPPLVTGAVSVGTAPLPFLAVYAVLFVLHGAFFPAHPPDITSSQHGELLAGVIVAVLFVVACVSLLWFLSGRRRWFFALVQLGVLGAAVDFLIDTTKGGTAVSILLVLTTLVSLFLGFAPSGWDHVGRRTPGFVTRVYAALGLAESPPVTVPPAADPRD